MRSIDRLFEKSSRALAQRTSRRSLLAVLGQVLTGAALIPLLPIDRSARAGEAPPAQPKPKAKPETDDPQSCDYWKYCAVDGFALAAPAAAARRILLPARHHALAHHLDRHLPQSQGRPRLHRFLQRLLRQGELRQLRMQPQ